MAVIWNPTVRKSVGIVIPIPKAGYKRIVGFGVCPDTSDPKLVKISVSNKIPSTWEVDVFTLSTRVWKTVYTGAPFKLCDLAWLQVFVNGVIYFLAEDEGPKSNFIISFDLKSEKFGEVCLPERLLRAPVLNVTNVNESLGLLEYRFEGKRLVCDVWSMKDGANKPFTKIYTVKVVGMSLISRVLAFRNNGEVVIQVHDGNNYEFRIEVYEPLSGLISGVGITGNQCSFSAKSYMESLLLLHESDSIIH
ncbi:ribonuclease H-like domain-containing protein [Tanacetum coccineum]